MNTQLNQLQRLLAEIDSLMGSVEVTGLIRDARSCAINARSVTAKAIKIVAELDALPRSSTPTLAVQVTEIQVRKLGICGKAYDAPETRRAYTYTEQPDNQDAWRLGEAASAASLATAGDLIDRGLVLLRELQGNGFGVFELETAPAQGGE